MKRWARKLVEENCRRLQEGPHDLRHIFRIMFSRPWEIMAEWLEGDAPKSMTFEEGEKRIRRAAQVLKDRVGAKDRYIALDLENGPEWIITFWAILMSGNRPYLVNRRHPAALTRRIISRLDILYSVAEGETNYPCMFIDVRELDSGRAGISEQEETFANEFALSTSATTLNEVICFYTGEQITNQLLNVDSILAANRLVPRFYHGALKQLAFLPFYHVFGLIAVYFWFAFFDRTMVFMKDYSPETILMTVKRFEVTHIFAVPLLWHTIEERVKEEVASGGAGKQKQFERGMRISTSLQKAFPMPGMHIARFLFRKVTGQLFGNSPQFLISGGGYIRESALYMINAIGYPLHNGYGMSETGITSVELRGNIRFRNAGSIGRPLDSVKYSIDDRGVLQIAGDSICRRIMRNGEEILTGGSYDTGDIVTADSEGYYVVKGRLGDRIIGENGENIDPDEIEKTLQIPHAKEISVFGYGEGAGEHPALVVQIPRNLETEKIRQAAETAREQAQKLPAAYQIRSFFFSFDPIRSEQAVKVSRPFLKRGIADGSIRLAAFDQVLSGEITGREPVPEEDLLGRRIRKIFAECSGSPEEEIMRDDHFLYDLGGSSLDYFSLVMKINEELGLQLVFDRESACYTIRQFCSEIQKKGGAAHE